MVRTEVPALMERRILNTIEHWIDLVGEWLTSEAGRRVLQDDICKRLHAGTIPTASVIAAAEAGHQAADLALRAFAYTSVVVSRAAFSERLRLPTTPRPPNVKTRRIARARGTSWRRPSLRLRACGGRNQLVKTIIPIRSCPRGATNTC